MRAVRLDRYGDRSVLFIAEVKVPSAEPGQAKLLDIYRRQWPRVAAVQAMALANVCRNMCGCTSRGS